MPKILDAMPDPGRAKYAWAEWLDGKPREFTEKEFQVFGISVRSFRAQACAWASAHGKRASVQVDPKTGSVRLLGLPGKGLEFIPRDEWVARIEAVEAEKAAIKRPKRTRPMPPKHKTDTKKPAKTPQKHKKTSS